MWSLILFVHLSSVSITSTNLDYFNTKIECLNAAKQVAADFKEEGNSDTVYYSCIKWRDTANVAKQK